MRRALSMVQSGPGGLAAISAPVAALTLAPLLPACSSQGTLYGTTYQKSSRNAGTIFKLDAPGHLTTLHAFVGNTDGANPVDGLTQDDKGKPVQRGLRRWSS